MIVCQRFDDEFQKELDAIIISKELIVKKYDGTRFITHEEIIREFRKGAALIDIRNSSSSYEGYLLASAVGGEEGEAIAKIREIKWDDYNGEHMITTGYRIGEWE